MGRKVRAGGGEGPREDGWKKELSTGRRAMKERFDKEQELGSIGSWVLKGQ